MLSSGHTRREKGQPWGVVRKLLGGIRLKPVGATARVSVMCQGPGVLLEILAQACALGAVRRHRETSPCPQSFPERPGGAGSCRVGCRWVPRTSCVKGGGALRVGQEEGTVSGCWVLVGGRGTTAGPQMQTGLVSLPHSGLGRAPKPRQVASRLLTHKVSRARSKDSSGVCPASWEPHSWASPGAGDGTRGPSQGDGNPLSHMHTLEPHTDSCSHTRAHGETTRAESGLTCRVGCRLCRKSQPGPEEAAVRLVQREHKRGSWGQGTGVQAWVQGPCHQVMTLDSVAPSPGCRGRREEGVQPQGWLGHDCPQRHLVAGPQPWAGHPCDQWLYSGEAAVPQPGLLLNTRAGGQRRGQGHAHSAP